MKQIDAMKLKGTIKFTQIEIIQFKSDYETNWRIENWKAQFNLLKFNSKLNRRYKVKNSRIYSKFNSKLIHNKFQKETYKKNISKNYSELKLKLKWEKKASARKGCPTGKEWIKKITYGM